MNEAFPHDLEAQHAAVFRYVYRMIGGWEEAQDLTQEAFTQWAAHGRQLTGPDSRRRWLFVVARNLAYSHLRKRSRDGKRAAEFTPVSDEARSPQDAASANETAALIARAVHALPDDLREVVVLREYESMTYDEIARITESALGTVKSRLARARALLRKKLATLLEVEA